MLPRLNKPDPGARKGPEALSEILSRLFAARGWGRRQARLHLEKAWETVVDAKTAQHTRFMGVRRGVLEIEVDNSVLMQELAHFHKRKILEKLRGLLAGTTVNDLRFKAGSWKADT